MKRKYANDIRELSQRQWMALGALKTLEEQLTGFWIKDMVYDMAHLAPELWDLLGLMLPVDQNARKIEHTMSANTVGMDEEGC